MQVEAVKQPRAPLLFRNRAPRSRRGWSGLPGASRGPDDLLRRDHRLREPRVASM